MSAVQIIRRVIAIERVKVMTFRVVKSSHYIYDNPNGREIVIVDSVDDRESAMVLAEVATLEHAEGIGVEYQKSGNLKGQHTGFTFVTNNGTIVWYEVRKN